MRTNGKCNNSHAPADLFDLRFNVTVNNYFGQIEIVGPFLKALL